ncbi:threonine and homoserine efflux system [Microbulbifer aggregans]|uniref:Threonine and homoserine efflux system n=1 Tax=Microbulbifer aggregans TaxID=1769779 RepID=A0A1C9WBZ0_9GAMM|nr:EamA family transporter [Microbulbifer aggregans]AOS98651.1 threonine and homoserine efflux system [Microbulbifer aggregans]
MASAGAALVALAALCWGLSGGIAGMLIAGGWDPFVVSFYRGAIGFLLLFTWLLLRPHKSGLGNARLWCWAVLAGFGVAGNFAFYFVSIAQGSVAVAVTLMYSAPVIVYLVSFALGLERPTPAKLVAITLVILGILLLTQVYDARLDGITPLGMAAGLLAGLFYAVFIFGFKYAAPHGSPQAILTIAFAVVAATLFWSADLNRTIAVPDAAELPSFVLLGLLGAGLSFTLYVIGLKRITPTVASIVAMVEPVTAALFGVIVLGENLAAPQVLGIALIVLTVSILSMHSRVSPP